MNKINYVTNSEICEIVKKNLCKLPRDIDGVVAVPQYGMLSASIISNFLEKPLYTVESLADGNPFCGIKKSSGNKYLIVFDFVDKANVVKKAKTSIKNNAKIDDLYSVCVGCGNNVNGVDLAFETYNGITLYEPTFFSSSWVEQCIFGIEGVLCERPANEVSERNEELYLNYITNATPCFLPKSKVLALCTNRLLLYAKQTEKWLNENNVKYGTLWMLDFESVDSKFMKRNSSEYLNMKTVVYEKYKDALLFVESDWEESLRLFNNTGKPVLCMDRNVLLQK